MRSHHHQKDRTGDFSKPLETNLNAFALLAIIGFSFLARTIAKAALPANCAGFANFLPNVRQLFQAAFLWLCY
jgi:hypothetical protein